MAGRDGELRELALALEASRRNTAFLELLNAVAVASNEASTVDEAVQTSLDEVCRLTGWPVGHAYMLPGDDHNVLVPSTLWHLDDPERFETFRSVTEAMPLGRGKGLPGRVLDSGKPAWISDVTKDANFPRNRVATDIGVKAGFGFPVLVGREVVAVMEFFSPHAMEPDDSLLEVMAQIGTQLGRVVERHRAEEALRDSEERFRAVAEPALDAIISADSEGNITYFNHGAERAFGYGAHEVIGKPLTILMPERFRDLHSQGLRRYVDTGESHVIGSTVELAGRRKNGKEFPLELALASWTSAKGVSFTGIIRDITVRKEAEEALRTALEREREATEHLRALDEMKNGFLSAVSHELRTPLSGVLGYALTLEQEELYRALSEREQREMLHRIAVSARKLERLLSDLLDLDRLTRGILEPRVRPTELDVLVRRVVEQADLRGHQVHIEAEPLTLQVDGPKVERIVENLIANVIKYVPEESRVWIRVHPEGEGALIAVEDEGPGIREEMRAAIFEPFLRGSDDHSHSPGTGIGLSLVARFAELHGGRAWVENRPAGGASFRVFLPAPPQGARAIPAVPSHATEPAASGNV
ncbi:MAG TPA: PAS domain S-box protein [Actinomycetota bacterium]|nr:PAS domain S-box protein [Actinomycetota bacterium]